MRRTTTLLFVLAMLLAACGESTDGKFGPELYRIACSGCHGSAAGGAAIGPALAASDAPALDLTDEQIFGAIRVGPGAMPGHPRLTDAQIRSLVEFLRELQEPFR